MHNESSLFTDAELKAIQARLQGDHNDPTSIFANRVRPKLKEILAWSTPSIKTKIRKLLVQKRKTEPDTPAKPNEEKTFQEFSTEIGY